jgi:DNA-binding NarL/FixJ family response regulator
MSVRSDVTEDVLRAVLDGRADDALAIATEAGEDAWFLVLASFAAFVTTDFAAAVEYADRALADSPDPVTRVAALGVRGFASAGCWPAGATAWEALAGGDPLPLALALLPGLEDSREAEVARYLVAEGALACGRLALAATAVELSGPLPRWDGHPFPSLVRIMRVRLLAFRGRIAEADTLLRADTGRHGTLVDLLLASTATLVRGNAAERGETRTLADRVEASDLPLDDYLSGGCRLLVAFGLLAVGDLARAARFILMAGRDEELSAASLLDRAFGFEMLVALAAAEGDRDAAEAWAERAAPLRRTPMAAATIARLDSRVALLAGRVRDAVEFADLAVALARAEGRVVEAAEGEIAGSRARVAASEAGIAVTRLEAAVAEADRTGYLAVRVSAARALRPSGRRLRPVSGTGWAGLSPRERDVALLVAEGASNAAIARALHLSDHTVRAHVSRVLAAFGAASRIAVGQALADRVPTPGAAASLTARQREVVDGLVRGLGNVAIAEELGISVKTVEKHLADVRVRWGARTRAEVARLARASFDE